MNEAPSIFTITLNPAIDRVELSNNMNPGVDFPQTIPGGKGINVSRILADCGIASTVIALLGEDNIDAFTPLFDDPLITNATLTIPGKTRENFTTLATENSPEHHQHNEGFTVSPHAFRELLEQVRGLVEPGDFVIVSGSIPPGISEKNFAELIDELTAAEAKICVDTSGPALSAIKRKKLWLIKPNNFELSELTGKQFDSTDQMLKTARGLAQKYQNILLSTRNQGAFLITREQILHAKCELPAEQTINTVGCGDSLLGAFIASIVSQASPADSLQFAAGIATATAAYPTTAQFDFDLAETLIPQVTLKEI